MKVRLSLSSKVDARGLQEILLMIQPYLNGKVVSMRAKSSIFINKDYFDKETGIKQLSRKHLNTPDVVYHREQRKKIAALINHVTEQYQATPMSTIENGWLKDVVDRYLHPETYVEQCYQERTFYELAEQYMNHKQFSIDHVKGIKVLLRCVSRYEGFVRATYKGNQDFIFDVDTIDKHTIEDFRKYLRNEKELSEQYPKLYERLFASYPASIKGGYRIIENRGSNAIIKLMKKLKSIFAWLNETERTNNNPFKGVSIGAEKFGTPFYISIDERNKIASTAMPTKALTTQRDIFVFQCLIGCRVGDLLNLASDNITDGVLSYTPYKTKDKGSQATIARVPLHPKAVELIERYKGEDKKGRLFPFISPQKYNNAIKEIFKVANITRIVEVRNALTGEVEQRPINEVASSHLARRTFVGNAYFKVQDPNLIGKMSGHVEGSKAFARYRRIEDETLRSVIDLIG